MSAHTLALLCPKDRFYVGFNYQTKTKELWVVLFRKLRALGSVSVVLRIVSIKWPVKECDEHPKSVATFDYPMKKWSHFDVKS